MASIPPACFNGGAAGGTKGAVGVKRRVGIALGLAVVAAAAGCSAKLETGYEPRKIGSNETERRGFYAAPFTREAREAEQGHSYDTDVARPRPGY